MRWTLTVGLMSAVLATGGCGSQVIPSVVVEGTTATIAIPYDMDVGYGTVWAGTTATSPPTAAYDPSNPYEDLQRGEMIFTLHNPGDPIDASPVAKLKVRYITRLMRDQTSAWAEVSQDEHIQPIALVDIPLFLVQEEGATRDLEIAVKRYRRDPTDNFTFKEVSQSYWDPYTSWWGWGQDDKGANSRSQRIPITVLDAPGLLLFEETEYHTPVEAWGPYGDRGDAWGWVGTGYLVDTVLENSVPRPEFRIRVPEPEAAPHAWEMSVTYPAERMRIVNVRLLRGDPSSGIVSWNASDVADPSNCLPSGIGQAGTLQIRAVDPENVSFDSRSLGVGVVFELANQDAPTCRRRIGDNEVTIETASYKGYDFDGNLLSQAPSLELVAYDLH